MTEAGMDVETIGTEDVRRPVVHVDDERDAGVPVTTP
jgi:hypothetical protein